jgi:hypothetical protein
MQLLEAINTQGCMIITAKMGPGAYQRRLYIPRVVADLHRQRRIATLKALLDVVSCGPPRSAVIAAAYAVGLEVNPTVAALFTSYPAGSLDEKLDGSDESTRDELIRVVRQLLSDAQDAK